MRPIALLLPFVLAACQATQQHSAPLPANAVAERPDQPLAPVPPPPSTPPPPTPPVPPDASWLLAQPEPAVRSTGDPKVDAYRDRLFAEPGWGPIFRRLLATVEANPAIVDGYDRMRAIDTPAEYVRHYVTPQRIAAGRALYRQLRRGAPNPSAPDGAPLELTLALWGALSDYGARKPDYDLLQAMLVLGAHGHIRLDTAFPLHDAALLVAERKVPRAKLRGWDSGRMGDVQYSPDFYRRLGQDGDGDGFVDIWDNRADILANLRIPDREEPRMLVIAVKPETFDRNDPGERRIVQAMEAQRMTVTYFDRYDGQKWPAGAIRWYGRYSEPFGKDGPAFLLMGAADPIAFRDPYRDYYEGNVERGFVLAVGLLAEAIAGRPIPDLKAMR